MKKKSLTRRRYGATKGQKMDNGCIKIGNINTSASTEVIGKLKTILDQHAIFHVVDGVMFYDSPKKAARTREIHRGRVREANKTQGDFCRNKLHQSDSDRYRELIVPDLYELDFMSLTDLDSEEADFLSILIYGEN